MAPLLFAVHNEPVHHPQINDHPDAKHNALKRLVSYEKRIDDFPGEIERKGEERHAIRAIEYGLPC